MNNILRIEGQITTEPWVEFQNKHGKFLSFILSCPRDSGTVDKLKIVVLESKIPPSTTLRLTDYVSIFGEVRTHNQIGSNKLNIFAYAQHVNKIEEPKEGYENSIELIGTICKDVVYRVTPMGKEITDILLAVNRYRKSSYLPLVVWGKNAVYLSDAKIGEKIKVTGRFQSRDYVKEGLDRTAFEISIGSVLERRIKD